MPPQLRVDQVRVVTTPQNMAAVKSGGHQLARLDTVVWACLDSCALSPPKEESNGLRLEVPRAKHACTSGTPGITRSASGLSQMAKEHGPQVLW